MCEHEREFLLVASHDEVFEQERRVPGHCWHGAVHEADEVSSAEFLGEFWRDGPVDFCGAALFVADALPVEEDDGFDLLRSFGGESAAYPDALGERRDEGAEERAVILIKRTEPTEELGFIVRAWDAVREGPRVGAGRGAESLLEFFEEFFGEPVDLVAVEAELPQLLDGGFILWFVRLEFLPRLFLRVFGHRDHLCDPGFELGLRRGAVRCRCGIVEFLVVDARWASRGTRTQRCGRA